MRKKDAERVVEAIRAILAELNDQLTIPKDNAAVKRLWLLLGADWQDEPEWLRERVVGILTEGED